MKNIVLTSILLLIIVGCTTPTTKSYIDVGLHNEVMEAKVGFPMISETHVKEHDFPEPYTETFKLELIYSGKTEDRIKMKRVVYYQGKERHTYPEDLEYEYKKYQKIRIKECRIQVLEANDQYVRYKVLDCHFI